MTLHEHCMLCWRAPVKELQRCPHFLYIIFWGCNNLNQAQFTMVELILTKGLFYLAVFTMLLFDIPSAELPDSAFPAGTPHTACHICCTCIKMIVIAKGYFSASDDIRGNHFHMLKQSIIIAHQWVWCLDKVVNHFPLKNND